MDGILLINKEKNMTSRDVINKLNHLLHTKKIGHTGTLDPIATGVLVVCIGKYTKLCELLTSTFKEYVATIKLGIKTDTGDITGNILEQQLKSVLNSFLGDSIQEVPIYSAVKVHGKKLYEYAREGKEVELPKRNINIQEIELLSFQKDEITFRTVVSKGTYIRALIEDIAKKLNTVGTMSSLNRTKQGKFKIEDTFTLKDIEENTYKLLTVEEVLKDLEWIEIEDEERKPVSNGAIIDKKFHNDIACLTENNKIIAIYKTYEKDKKKAKPYIML